MQKQQKHVSGLPIYFTRSYIWSASWKQLSNRTKYWYCPLYELLQSIDPVQDKLLKNEISLLREMLKKLEMVKIKDFWLN